MLIILSASRISWGMGVCNQQPNIHEYGNESSEMEYFGNQYTDCIHDQPPLSPLTPIVTLEYQYQ